MAAKQIFTLITNIICIISYNITKLTREPQIYTAIEQHPLLFQCPNLFVVGFGLCTELLAGKRQVQCKI